MIRDIILHSPTAYREPATVAQATTADQVVALWLHARSRHTQRGRLDESQVVRIVRRLSDSSGAGHAKPCVGRNDRSVFARQADR